MRDLQLINDASVCQDAHWLQDPSVRTRAQANDSGHQNCPLFDRCSTGTMLGQGKLGCIPRHAQDVARYAAKARIAVASEMSDFRNAPVFDVRGFIDPYDDPDKLVTDKDEILTAVERWANLIVGQPETSEQLVADIKNAHCRRHDAFTEGCNDCSIARVAAQDRTEVVLPGGTPKVVARNQCRCPILRVGDFCPVHGG